MRIDLAALDTERFNVEPREHPQVGPVVLIVPDKATVFKMSAQEEHLRSLLCRPDGEVISSGFPKFYNFGEVAAHDSLTKGVLTSERDILFRVKLDGSLVIRSVVDGQVIWRTRGSHMLGDFEEPVMTIVREWHPRLLDPAFGKPNESWLFEYIGPANQIVIRYDSASLMALGRTRFNADGRLETFLFSKEIIDEIGIDQAPTYPRFDSVEAVKAHLEPREGEEGYVSWAQLSDDPLGPYHLTKWKTNWYLRLHALRSNASPRFIREYCVMHELTSLDKFQAKMAEDGFDWEAVSYLEPHFRDAEARIMEHILIADAVDLAIEDEGLDKLPDRKATALACKKLGDDFKLDWVFHYAIQSLTGKRDAALDLLRARMLDLGAGEFQHLKKSWSGLKGLKPGSEP